MTHFKCPNEDCDSKQFIQQSEQTELVTVDENSEPESFEGMGEVNVLKIECADCETVIFEE